MDCLVRSVCPPLPVPELLFSPSTWTTGFSSDGLPAVWFMSRALSALRSFAIMSPLSASWKEVGSGHPEACWDSQVSFCFPGHAALMWPRGSSAPVDCGEAAVCWSSRAVILQTDGVQPNPAEILHHRQEPLIPEPVVLQRQSASAECCKPAVWMLMKDEAALREQTSWEFAVSRSPWKLMVTAVEEQADLRH